MNDQTSAHLTIEEFAQRYAVPVLTFQEEAQDVAICRALEGVPDDELMHVLLKHLYKFFFDDVLPESSPDYCSCLRAMHIRLCQQDGTERFAPEIFIDKLPDVESQMLKHVPEAVRKAIFMASKAEYQRKYPGLRNVPKSVFREMEYVPSNMLYLFAQRAIARAPEGIFQVDGDYPKYTERKKGFLASMEMRPHDDLPISLIANYHDILFSMSEKLNSLGDLAVDVMDIILSRHAQEPQDTITITTDEILLARGLKMKVKDGYSAGFRPEEKRAVASIMSAMDNLWIVVGEMEVYVKGQRRSRKYREKSRLMMITGVIEPSGASGGSEAGYPIVWRIRLGEVFETLIKGNVASQYALLSSKTLQYSPVHQRWEKRLSRYFHPLWRIRQASGRYWQPFKVQTLLDAIGVEMDRRNPQRTKERLEGALERLSEDRVISMWQYSVDPESEVNIGARGWVDSWLQCKIIIEPPLALLAQYGRARASASSGEGGAPTSPQRLLAGSLAPAGELEGGERRAEEGEEELTGERIAELRKTRRLTQEQFAFVLGVSRSYIAQIERGGRTLTPGMRDRIGLWLANA